MRSFWINWVNPKSKDTCPYMRQKREIQRERRERTCEDRGRNSSDAKEFLEPPESGRGKEGFYPRDFRGSMAQPTF